MTGWNSFLASLAISVAFCGLSLRSMDSSISCLIGDKLIPGHLPLSAMCCRGNQTFRHMKQPKEWVQAGALAAGWVR